ncbi:TRAP transporter substrate-binding protein DctP [Pokkaliibacter sp. CJK22405]|uniref:TRAP transporter substrate-binding protein DctP n=1 Tax=Pokkaliibacter sp. CJK22405 TaxID=3384615 RepID=UPI003984DED3
MRFHHTAGKDTPRFHLSLKRGRQALVAAVGALLLGQAQATTVLTFSDHQPLDGMRTRFLDEVFFPAVERESEGRLKIERHWDGELAIAYDALPTLRSGKTDLSVIVPEYKANDLPLHQIFKGFPVGPSGARQVDFFREVYREVPAFNQELASNNIREVFLATGYPSGFFGTRPLQSIGDIEGQKWRSASFWHLDFLKSAGAQPVKMHWGPEIFDALGNGALDGIFVNIDSAYNLKLNQAAPYALVSPRLWLGHLYIVGINEKVWETLPQEDQAAFQRAAETSYQQLGQVMDTSYTNMVKQLEAGGTKVRTLTDEEVAHWLKATDYQQHQQSWAKSEALKDVEAQPVIDQVARILEKYSESGTAQ